MGSYHEIDDEMNIEHNVTKQCQRQQITQTTEWKFHVFRQINIVYYIQGFLAVVPSTTGLQEYHCNIWRACTVVPCSSGFQMKV
jgi:hypothetical protein